MSIASIFVSSVQKEHALTEAGVVRKAGKTGKGTYYTLAGKGLRNGLFADLSTAV